MRVLHLAGSPRDMGRAFGEACREEIATFYELRMVNALTQAKQYGGREVSEEDALAAARACMASTASYDPCGWDELQGIAEGANMPVERVLAMNGLTDLRDVLAWGGDLESLGGCSSLVAMGDVTADGRLICGQTWDLATDNLPFVLGVHRQPPPDVAPETWCLTTVGCLSLIGMNAHGVAVGTTNIRTWDARPGVTYLSIIHRALSTTTFEGAVRAVTQAPRAGAHFYYVCGGEGQASVVECTATRHTRLDLESGWYAHTNHCLVPENAAIESAIKSGSSKTRQERLAVLLEQHRGRLTPADVKGFWGDTDHGELAICRDDFGGINTNGAVVMTPEEGTIDACHGLPSRAEWVDLRGA